MRKSLGRTRRESSAIWPGDLDARRAAADDDEREPFSPLLGIVLQRRHLEGPEDPSPDLERVVDRLHPRRPAGELVVTEVGLAGACADDQAVVRDLEGPPSGRIAVTVRAVQIEAGHLREPDLHVALATKHVAYGRGDVPLGEDGRGHLIEERLEEMVVDPVHEGHLDRGAPQEAGGEEPAEAASDDNHWWGLEVPSVSDGWAALLSMLWPLDATRPESMIRSRSG